MNLIPESACPNCGAVHNAATSADLDDAAPEVGDISICFDCGSVNRFDYDLQIIAMDEEAILSMDEETQHAIRDGVRAIQRMKKFNLKLPDGRENL